jgi:hypothetical protein
MKTLFFPAVVRWFIDGIVKGFGEFFNGFLFKLFADFLVEVLKLFGDFHNWLWSALGEFDFYGSL